MTRDTRKPSTIIAELRRRLRNSEHARDALRRDKFAATDLANAWQASATRYQQEAAEWKRRFDELLAMVPLAPIAERGAAIIESYLDSLPPAEAGARMRELAKKVGELHGIWDGGD